MTDLRSIPYGFTAFWKTPAEAQSGAPADCKAKAVALYEKMRENGATNVRLVIGKRTATSRQTHAWLAWDTDSGSYVLDPTFNWAACTAAQVGKRNYQPLYAYAGSKKFRAASALVAQN
jgi:predicted transglutaminase-like cysteine proteinase